MKVPAAHLLATRVILSCSFVAAYHFVTDRLRSQNRERLLRWEASHLPCNALGLRSNSRACAARKCPSMSSTFPRNTTGEGNPGAYSNDPDSTTCNMPCSASSSHTTVWAAPQMSSLRSSSACLDDLHAGRCCGGATLAYPIPVRHPKFHHGGGIGSSLRGSFSTIDPARYGIDWPRSSLWVNDDVSGETKI